MLLSITRTLERYLVYSASQSLYIRTSLFIRMITIILNDEMNFIESKYLPGLFLFPGSYPK